MAETNTQREVARQRLAWALGEEPFPWQLALLDRFLEGALPSAVDVPTGLGKTAVMAIWLAARAAGAAVPLRLIYVVDRRAVVDQATKVAEGLRSMVEGEADLRRALGLEGTLPISTLRGKYLDNRQWLADPGVPAIVLGTVDMIGSRLLFQGYGVSAKMRPYHAGLLGADSLVVLDEAHLVPPFERLIETLASGRDGNAASLRPDAELDTVVPALRFLSLSATGRGRDGALSLGPQDRDHPVVTRRLRAAKRTNIRDEIDPSELPEKLADEAWALSASGTRTVRCIVFCDRRDDATKVLEGLAARSRKAGGGRPDAELFVGGRRLFEREDAARWLEQRGFLAGSTTRLERATFVVATSAGEVGVDLDADDMVCDLVAWERMVQRLGRVNRRGDGDAAVVVVPASSDLPDQQSRRTAARAILERLPLSVDGAFDASPGAIVGLKARCDREPELAELAVRASTPVPLHPPLLRPTIEAWSMTSLEEHTGRPEVVPWIRGWVESEEPQTTVVWREHLPVTDGGELFRGMDLEAFRDAAQPHLAERLEAETWRVVEWLAKRLKRLEGRRSGEVVAVILDGLAGTQIVRRDDLVTKDKRMEMQRALLGGLLLVDVRVGGLQNGLLSDESDAATDVTTVDDQARVVPFRVRRTTELALASEASTHWREEARIAVAESDDGDTAWLVIESLAGQAAESEEGRSVGARRAQLLDEHESWAEHAARAIAGRVGLPAPYREALAVAARLHDEGKRSMRWQRAFHATSAEGVFAKTTSRPNLRVLDHYRHEFGSLPYAEKHERVWALEAPLRELCLHLIGAHHGGARPLLRTDGAEEPPTRLAQRAEEVALRFAALEKRWGPWGLAWWEALLRAADQQASRRNDEEGIPNG